ncbi:caltractin-like [Amblyraja radiata]|uniref:caltractin-like n=1 Tax=Amblyraja radiata TaxID=386614 RepID=UPI001403CD48|nr:caltractin-like [Amblyraja radiata]
MPSKKKKIVKKKKKTLTGKESKKPSESYNCPLDSIAPENVPPPIPLGEKLLAFLQEWKEEQQEMACGDLSCKIQQELTPQDIRDLRVVFNNSDTNKVGYLNATDVHSALRTLGFGVNQEELGTTLRSLGPLKKENVSFREFLQIVIEHQGEARDTLEEIKQGFDLFDCDSDGKITFDNLKEACKSAGVYFSHQELREMIREVDTDGDGTVDMEEFIDLMLQTSLF